MVAIVIVAGGLFWWQNSQSHALRREIQVLQKQNKTLASAIGTLSQKLTETEKSSPEEKVTEIKTLSPLCTAAPTGTDIGRDVYPIDPKYKNLEFLGQLFTASTCGPERLSKIDGVDGDNYTLGSAVRLIKNPNQNLINTFKEIGYKCEKDMSEILCKKWELWDVVKVSDLLKLEPFHENFEGDDCRKCG